MLSYTLMITVSLLRIFFDKINLNEIIIMKTKITQLNFKLAKSVALFVSFGLFVVSCSSNDDGFDDANGNVAKKYISKIVTQSEGQTSVANITYNNEGQVVSASTDNDVKYFSYFDDGRLKKISGGGENILTSEVINEIHAAYEIGDVLDYDSKGNPTILELYDVDYYGNQVTNTAHLSYDTKPFTFYHTLDAAGIIAVLYDVRLQFYTPAEIIMAKKLLPVYNPIKAVIKDSSNQEIGTITVNYTYDNENYPTNATVISIDDVGYATSSTVIYQYK